MNVLRANFEDDFLCFPNDVLVIDLVSILGGEVVDLAVHWYLYSPDPLHLDLNIFGVGVESRKVNSVPLSVSLDKHFILVRTSIVIGFCSCLCLAREVVHPFAVVGVIAIVVPVVFKVIVLHELLHELVVIAPVSPVFIVIIEILVVRGQISPSFSLSRHRSGANFKALLVERELRGQRNWALLHVLVGALWILGTPVFTM